MTARDAGALEQAVNAEVCSVCEGHEDDHTGCANAVQHFLRQSERKREHYREALARLASTEGFEGAGVLDHSFSGRECRARIRFAEEALRDV